ncbi:beta-ketoacyl-ACP synthase III [Gordonia crocea]|uniref:beta-ketoacyl-ACP synthase III n=1 Tax=Gordonia crocea TaxID=589162 RepID=UPI001E57BBF2|nr:beta-ketoacyl-ACP synthase III [Gordonia crocea]
MAVIDGVGGYLPPGVITNADLGAELDTSDEWIRRRTGIGARRWVADERIATSDLAVLAARRAIAARGDAQAPLGAVIVATMSPDRRSPATAPVVADKLGLQPVAAFDVGAACGGFVYALAVASSFVQSSLAEAVVVVGAECMSRVIDRTDRATAVLFGDGAGAVVVRRARSGDVGRIHCFDLGSDGANVDLITQKGGGSLIPEPVETSEKWLQVQGRATYRHAVARMSASATAVLERAGWQVAEIDVVVPHQANARIIDAVATNLGLPAAALVKTLHRMGNTSAASIPLALAHCAATGALAPTQRVLLTALGGGLAWGSAAVTWEHSGQVIDPLLGCADESTGTSAGKSPGELENR